MNFWIKKIFFWSWKIGYFERSDAVWRPLTRTLKLYRKRIPVSLAEAFFFLQLTSFNWFNFKYKNKKTCTNSKLLFLKGNAPWKKNIFFWSWKIGYFERSDAVWRPLTRTLKLYRKRIPVSLAGAFFFLQLTSFNWFNFKYKNKKTCTNSKLLFLKGNAPWKKKIFFWSWKIGYFERSDAVWRPLTRTLKLYRKRIPVSLAGAFFFLQLTSFNWFNFKYKNKKTCTNSKLLFLKGNAP